MFTAKESNMNYNILSPVISFLCVLVLVTQGYADNSTEKAKSIVSKVVETVGGPAKLRALSDVEYTYFFRKRESSAVTVTLERYMFDGERSWAKVLVNDSLEGRDPFLPAVDIQGFDGNQTWLTRNGSLVTKERDLKQADFSRKTNYYWFTMMTKLLDPGLTYELLESREVNGVDYQVVQVGFEKGVGDVSDIYVLYINPETFLIDQFLFTVMDFGVKEPFLMKVQYREVSGLKLPLNRAYIASDWTGTIKQGAHWTDEVCIGVRFNNGFTADMFDRP